MAGLIKLIIIGLIVTLAIQLWRRAKGSQLPPPQQGEAMLPCAHCQTHIPKSQVIYYREQPFCSEAHKQQYINKQ